MRPLKKLAIIWLVIVTMGLCALFVWAPIEVKVAIVVLLAAAATGCAIGEVIVG